MSYHEAMYRKFYPDAAPPVPEGPRPGPMPYAGPELVYGAAPIGSGLVVVQREWAVRAAQEVERWEAVSTWREAIEVNPTFLAHREPLWDWTISDHLSDYENEDEALDAPFDPYADTPGADELGGRAGRSR